MLRRPLEENTKMKAKLFEKERVWKVKMNCQKNFDKKRTNRKSVRTQLDHLT